MPASATSNAVLPRCITLQGPSALALRIARLFPCLHILAFDDDWSAIDRARDAANALGIAERVRFHHTSAAPPVHSRLQPTPRRAA